MEILTRGAGAQRRSAPLRPQAIVSAPPGRACALAPLGHFPAPLRPKAISLRPSTPAPLRPQAISLRPCAPRPFFCAPVPQATFLRARVP